MQAANEIEKYQGIYQLPTKFEPSQGSITLGDLHSNAPKLIYALLTHQIAEFDSSQVSDPAAEYQRFIECYEKMGAIAEDFSFTQALNKEEQTRASREQLEQAIEKNERKLKAYGINRNNTKQTLKDIKQEFDQFLTKLKITNPTLIRLIGDELSDRGSNDYFILKIIDFLKKQQVPVTTLISNHSDNFIQNKEQIKNKQPYINSLLSDQCTSLTGLALFKNNDVIDDAEFDTLSNAYLSTVKVLDYTLSADGNDIQLFTHAPVAFETIKRAAQAMGIPYRDSTARELANTIDRINALFQIHVQQNDTAKFFDYSKVKIPEAMTEAEQNQFPLMHLIWNRWTENLDKNPLTRPATHPKHKYAISYAHGHDSYQSQWPHVTNTDNICGKGSIDYTFTARKHYQSKIDNNLDQAKVDKLQQKLHSFDYSALNQAYDQTLTPSLNLDQSEIYQFPTSIEPCYGTITVGDLNGNAAKLAYLLFQHDIVGFDRNRVVNASQGYAEFIDLYQQMQDLSDAHEQLDSIAKQIDYTKKTLPTANETERAGLQNQLLDLLLQKDQYQTIAATTKNTLPVIIKQFHQFINNLIVKDPQALLRLIGDELADRGACDYFTLCLLELLQNNGVDITTIISNHSYEFIAAYETMVNDGTDFSSDAILLEKGQSASLRGLKLCLDAGGVSKERLQTLVQKVYHPTLKLLDYNLSTGPPQTIRLYTHAPIRFDVIAHAAFQLGVVYDDSTAENLAKTIDKINTVFQENYVKKNKIHTLMPRLPSGTTEEYLDEDEIIDYPFHHLIFNRWQYDIPDDTRPQTKNGYNIEYTHGHDKYLSMHSHIENIDNDCGKFSPLKEPMLRREWLADMQSSDQSKRRDAIFHWQRLSHRGLNRPETALANRTHDLSKIEQEFTALQTVQKNHTWTEKFKIGATLAGVILGLGIGLGITLTGAWLPLGVGALSIALVTITATAIAGFGAWAIGKKIQTNHTTFTPMDTVIELSSSSTQQMITRGIASKKMTTKSIDLAVPTALPNSNETRPRAKSMSAIPIAQEDNENKAKTNFTHK